MAFELRIFLSQKFALKKGKAQKWFGRCIYAALIIIVLILEKQAEKLGFRVVIVYSASFLSAASYLCFCPPPPPPLPHIMVWSWRRSCMSRNTPKQCLVGRKSREVEVTMFSSSTQSTNAPVAPHHTPPSSLSVSLVCPLPPTPP